MKKRKIPLNKLTISLLLIISITGCSSGYKNISPDLSNKIQGVENLGHVQGRGCGTILLSIIPILQNSRVERAYSDAISKKPNATGLINVTLREKWNWWYLGTTRCVTIEGEAIK